MCVCVVTGEFFVEYMRPQLKYAWERASETALQGNMCEIAHRGNVHASKRQGMRASDPWYLTRWKERTDPRILCFDFQA